MKNKLLFAGMAAATLLSAAVSAAPAVIGDDELSAISGKDNTTSASGSLSVTAAMTGDNSANIQWGFYQWGDDHSTDGSKVKGGNQVDGTNSTVQASVAASNNAFFWGGLGQNELSVSTDLGDGAMNMGYGTFGNGGF